MIIYPKEFIEVTSVCDNKRAAIRAVCINCITENEETDEEEGITVDYRTIDYDGGSIDVIESYEEIMAKIYKAEL